jgi:hypothetical protein
MRMRFSEIEYFAPINEVDENKVNEIAESIKANGYVGCPILICGESLVTGSHRLTALKQLAEQEDNDEIDYIGVRDMLVAADVSDIVDEAMRKFEEENGYTPDIQYDDIGWIFEGTWVERYKSEIEEW